MIKTQQLVPEVYYKRSRDFQLIGRIFDFLANYLKTGDNAVENILLSDTFDWSLVDLMISTLGFKKSHEYNSRQLLAFCSAFPLILRNKGNLSSISYILTLMENAQNIKEPIITELRDYVLYVYISEELTDLALFEDVLDYILPAGISYRIVYTSLIKQTKRDRYKWSDVDFHIDTSQHKGQDGSTDYYNMRTIYKSQIVGLWDPNTPLPTPSDSAGGRIDNVTQVPALDSSDDIGDWIQN